MIRQLRLTSTESSSYFSEKTGEIANRGLKTQGIGAEKMMVEDLRRQAREKKS
jgi:hypothetical protein